MSWDKYSKEVQDNLKNNPAIVNAINNMARDGYDKEYAQKITGAPYEVVDRLYKNQGRGGKRRDEGPRREEEE